MKHNEELLDKKTIDKIAKIERWFNVDYLVRLAKISRYKYLGLKCDETRYALEMEAYKKENELRVLKGLEPLPETKYKKLL